MSVVIIIKKCINACRKLEENTDAYSGHCEHAQYISLLRCAISMPALNQDEDITITPAANQEQDRHGRASIHIQAGVVTAIVETSHQHGLPLTPEFVEQAFQFN